MINKDHLYIGSMVSCQDHECLVIDKQRDKCKLLDTCTLQIISILYSDIDSINNYEVKEYNRAIRTINSKSLSRLEKNTKTQYIFDDGSKIWFTSDTHFYHDNIIKFCHRPFESVEEMNETIINNWNSEVSEDDTIFHLGDFAYGGSSCWTSILPRLNGHIHLITGNHDIKNLKSNYHSWFESISSQQLIEVEGRKIYLNHYPFLTYAGIYREEETQVWQLFGHVHTSPRSRGADDTRLKYLLPYQYDVGVDNNDFQPINFKTVERIITQQIKDYSHE